MTMIQINQVSLKRLDQIRKQRGIRTRAKALEIVLSELIVPDPLDTILDAPKSKDLIPARILKEVQADHVIRAKGQTVQTTPHQLVKARLLERRKNAT